MKTWLCVAVAIGWWCGDSGLLRAQPAPDARKPLSIAASSLSLTLVKITLDTGTLRPEGDSYAGTYQVRVSPLPIGSESGRISVRVPEADRQRLARGETVSFRGEAVNGSGKHRQVDARATPEGPNSGRVRLRVMADGRKLVFHTTYRFGGP